MGLSESKDIENNDVRQHSIYVDRNKIRNSKRKNGNQKPDYDSDRQHSINPFNLYK